MTTTRPTLLIVTDRADFAADFLITRLLERDLPHYRLDADVLDSSTVSCRLEGNVQERRIAYGGNTLDLALVKSVWYRRALRPSGLERISSPFRAFAATELRQLFEGMLADGARWVNPIAATEAAERKLFQLRLAPGCGLAIPPTLVSNEPAALAAFAEHEQRVICKPISQGFVQTGSEQFAVHTQAVQVSDFLEHAGGMSFPTLLQRRIPKGNDVRVTIIGKAIFPVEIHVPEDAPVDWRAASDGLAYRPCAIPASVEAGCRELMACLHLLYGAFDFIRTPAGEWHFLEVNPAGEWAWLEVALGLPMRDAFIDLLFGD